MRSWVDLREPKYIGRAPDADIVLSDPGVSRRHCEVVARADSVVLRDLGSRNGTFLNRVPVAEARLVSGDRFCAADTTLLFIAHSGATSLRGAAPGGSVWPEAQPITEGDGETDDGGTAGETDAGSTAGLASDFELLCAVTRVLGENTSIEAGIEEVFGLLAKAKGKARMAVLTSLEDDEKLRILVTKGFEGETIPPLQFDEHLMGDAISTGRAFFLPDRASAAGQDGSGGAASVLCLPFVADDTLRGALCLSADTPDWEFTAEDLALMSAIAKQMGIGLKRARTLERLRSENAAFRGAAFGPVNLLGRSPVMRQVFEQIIKMAATDSPVLLLGESGTGKELVAHALHANSPRRDGPLICLNCAALPEALVESEMFGHERGAFTGAVARKPGRFELADKGTLFLDEISDLSLAAQAKLLRVLEAKCFERLGGTATVSVDVRIIAASARDPQEAMRDRRFREDLYYRISALQILLPPLRERGKDIDLLAEYFVDRLARHAHRPIRGISAEAMEAMRQYPWPGNVRELRNCIERAVVLGRGPLLEIVDLPLDVAVPEGRSAVDSGTLADVERQHIVRTLANCGGDRKRAAQVLGISRSTLYRRMLLYGIASPKRST